MSLELTAKKKFGQNFLVNPVMQDRVILELTRNITLDIKKIVEIGPGRGDLTKHLFDLNKEIQLLEIDSEAVELLKKNFHDKHFDVVNVDALNIFENLRYKDFFDKNSILFSNLPFNVGSRILVELGLYLPFVPFVVILQKEVAGKTSENNKLTFFGAWLDLFWNIKQVFQISRGNFSPAPKVMSALITGKPNNLSWLNNFEDREKAKKLLKALFAQPKKTVANNLKNMGWCGEDIENFLTNNNHPHDLRISWGNYKEVLEQLLKH